MNPAIHTDIPFTIDMPQLLKRLRLEEDDDFAEDIGEMVKGASGLGRPKSVYTTAFIDKKSDASVISGNITFKSRVMTVNLEKVHRFFPFVVTAGTELDEWAASFTDGLERYWADCIQEAALKSASAWTRARISEENGLSGVSAMNPGSLQDWPISEQAGLFTLLGDVKKAIGVELTESYLMLPIKSVSGILFASDTTFENCQLCPREDCPGRRAPYDEGLLESRYR